MDHLTWLIKIQQTDPDGDLPVLRQLQLTARADETTAAKREAAPAAGSAEAAQASAIEELIAAAQQTLTMQEVVTALQRSSAAETFTTLATQRVSAIHGSADAHFEGSRPVFSGGGPTMEEISHFFEIDARRF